MTYKEYVSKKEPARIGDSHFGGVKGCPGNYITGAPICGKCGYGPGPYNCEQCWNQEIPEEKKEDPVDKINIHKIIDDAMEKKDRTVSIYIGRIGTTINVQPYESEVPHWIYNPNSDRFPYECSACGGESKTYTTYCPYCGEQMKRSKFEVEDGESDE